MCRKTKWKQSSNKQASLDLFWDAIVHQLIDTTFQVIDERLFGIRGWPHLGFWIGWSRTQVRIKSVSGPQTTKFYLLENGHAIEQPGDDTASQIRFYVVCRIFQKVTTGFVHSFLQRGCYVACCVFQRFLYVSINSTLPSSEKYVIAVKLECIYLFMYPSILH
jgi:hypothetical protein